MSCGFALDTRGICASVRKLVLVTDETGPSSGSLSLPNDGTGTETGSTSRSGRWRSQLGSRMSRESSEDVSAPSATAAPAASSGASEILSAAQELRSTLKLVQDLRQTVDDLRDTVVKQGEQLTELANRPSAADDHRPFQEIHAMLENMRVRLRDLEETKQDAPPVVIPTPLGLTPDVEVVLNLHPEKPPGLNFNLDDLLRVVIRHRASDLHLKADASPIVRLNGELVPIGEKVLTEADTQYLVLSAIPEMKRQRLLHLREIDHAHVAQGVRFRVNAFLERGRLSASMRMISSAIPTFDSLGLPHVLGKLSSLKHGMVLVTGPAGSGKSTTLASMVDWMNKNRKSHIVTIEDPIEYFHFDENSFITQREIGTDTRNFAEALRQCLRQDPNVILVGEMRDAETVMTAVTAAETGHLVLSTLHTPNTVLAIDRIVDTFSGDQQRQVRMLLSTCLKGVVSQKLLSRADGAGRVAAIEVLVVTSTIASLILEGNTKEIYEYVRQGASEGMPTFTQAMMRLVELGIITREEAMANADQTTEMRLAVSQARISTPAGLPQAQQPAGLAPQPGGPPAIPVPQPSAGQPQQGGGNYLNWL